MKYLVLFFFTLLFFSSCDENIYGDSQRSMLIIEGSIEDGAFPRVFVTTNILLREEMKDSRFYIDSLYNHIMTWAVVTISDGDEEVMLLGHKDKDYMPPYFYSTSRMRGEAGKTYHLKVECDGLFAEAVTSIPNNKLSFNVEQVSTSSENKFDLVAKLNGYADFCRIEYQMKNGPNRWSYSNNGSYSYNDIVSADQLLRIDRAYRDTESLFSKGDTLVVKVSVIDSITFRFWNDYDRLVNLSRNPFFSSSENIHGNISGDGIGIWAGYNASFLQYTVK